MTPERDEFEQVIDAQALDCAYQICDECMEKIGEIHRRALARAILQVAQPELYDAGVEPDENYSATQARDILERDQRVALAKARAETWREAKDIMTACAHFVMEDVAQAYPAIQERFEFRAAALDKEVSNGSDS